MKLLIGSDFHINEKKRLEDTITTLNQIVSITESVKPNVFICLGDVFDKRRPTPREMQVFNKWLMSMTSLAKEVILLEGNHDQDNGISSLSYLKDLNINGVKIVDPPILFPSEDIPTYYFGHEQLSGAVADNGVALEGGVSTGWLIKNYPKTKIFGFGHFHKPQVLSELPLAFYAGSINKVNFSERDDEKKLWYFENDKLVSLFPLYSRPMLQFDVNVELSEAAGSNAPWDDANLHGALVKVVYTGTKANLLRVNEEGVYQIMKNKGVKELFVKYEVTDNEKPRNSKLTESITEEKALTEYFSNKDISDELKNEIVDEGLKIVKESNL